MDPKSYTLEELESHVTTLFSAGTTVPLSPLRLASYLKNPRAEQTDHILFEMHHEGRLVAYRTLMPDCCYDESGMPQRFAWLSGNFVDPGYRRRGLSTRLLQLAEAKWEGRLMYTNYAPDSKAVYDRTGVFPLLAERKGWRFHLRSAFGELWRDRLGGRSILNAGDSLLNLVQERKLRQFPDADPVRCRIERITSFDPGLTQLIDRSRGNSLFRRDAGTFSWILDHPWVTGQETPTLDYHFSYGARRFENILWKFTLPGEGGVGLLWLVVHDRKLSAPYLFTDQPGLLPIMAAQLMRTMISNGCAYTTIRHPELALNLMEYKKWFLAVRPMPQLLFAHKNFIEAVPRTLAIQDGDGDVVFTG